MDSVYHFGMQFTKSLGCIIGGYYTAWVTMRPSIDTIDVSEVMYFVQVSYSNILTNQNGVSQLSIGYTKVLVSFSLLGKMHIHNFANIKWRFAHAKQTDSCKTFLRMSFGRRVTRLNYANKSISLCVHWQTPWTVRHIWWTRHLKWMALGYPWLINIHSLAESGHWLSW